MRVKPGPRATHRVGGLVVLLILASVVGAGLPGLTASSPVNLDQAIESIDESVCEDYAINNVSEQCADWVNKCCLTWAFPYMDLVAGPDGERVYAFATGDDLGGPANVVAISPATGETIWRSSTPAGPQMGSIDVSPDGSRVFVTADDDAGQIMTIGYDAVTGEQVWVAHHEHAGGAHDFPYDIVVGPEGERLFVTGQAAHGEPTWVDLVTLAYDAVTGRLVWNDTHDGPGSQGGDEGRAVDVSPDGSRVFVTGQDDTGRTTTIAYNSSTGEQAWIQKQDVTFGKPNDIAVDPAGRRVYIIESPDFVATTVAYNATTGELAWRTESSGSMRIGSGSIAVSPDGSRVFTTWGSRDIYTAAFDATTGTELWKARENYLVSELGGDEGRDLTISPDGSAVYVASVAWRYTELLVQGIEDSTYLTLAYAASNGTRQWAARYDAMGLNDIPFAIDVAPDGSRVYVVGQSDDPTAGTSAVTVAYNAAGPNSVIGPLVERDGV